MGARGGVSARGGGGGGEQRARARRAQRRTGLPAAVPHVAKRDIHERGARLLSGARGRGGDGVVAARRCWAQQRLPLAALAHHCGHSVRRPARALVSDSDGDVGGGASDHAVHCRARGRLLQHHAVPQRAVKGNGVAVPPGVALRSHGKCLGSPRAGVGAPLAIARLQRAAGLPQALGARQRHGGAGSGARGVRREGAGAAAPHRAKVCKGEVKDALPGRAGERARGALGELQAQGLRRSGGRGS